MIKLEKKKEMNRDLVNKIYEKSANAALEMPFTENQTTPWIWEENMVLNTVKELKYALAVNHHALTLDQLAIIEDVFGIYSII